MIAYHLLIKFSKKMQWTKEQLVFLAPHTSPEEKAQWWFSDASRVHNLGNSPPNKLIQRCVISFSQYDKQDKKKKPGRPCNTICQEKVSRAKQIITGDLNISTWRSSYQLNISYSSDQRNLRINVSMYPHKIQVCQNLHDVVSVHGSCRRVKKTRISFKGRVYKMKRISSSMIA